MAGFTSNLAVINDGLSSKNFADRVAGLGAANRAEILTAANLRPFLADQAIEVQYRAVELTARIPDGSKLIADLVALLDQPELAEVTAFVLGELEVASEPVVEALCLQVSSHQDPLCRESAVAALGALESGLDTVLEATKDIATVRRRAVIALAAFSGPEVETALRTATQDRDWQVRQAAEDLLT